MQNPVRERIAKLREEMAQLTEAHRLYSQGGKKLHGAAGDHARRLQRAAADSRRAVGFHRLEKAMKVFKPFEPEQS
jgi:hypothetical protein